ncbi:hypothetical protein [Corynebacterium lowii]|uniref:DNA helicase DnaB-like N-terminal domain-containing protein n=1 Tax=Corynebacterium lowii TaxID=1544413 RepID=A0A0Q0UFX7_9CORY|nr:hypothetical protein [Corynebacterium lowii]KQB87059.1 hypothetical protein Clow_00106 [Corynebacterium lowii]MDP9852357.1 replicative DNA helicase [Corynebacterium lowii]
MTNQPSNSMEVLAALIEAPAPRAKKQLARLVAEDFPDWKHQRVFEALHHITYPDHPGFGSVHVQIERWLLDEGYLRDSDDGLRAFLAELVSHRGHLNYLEGHVQDLIEESYHTRGGAILDAAADSVRSAPLEESSAFLAEAITKLRSMYLRINHHPTVKEAKAA